MEYFQEALKIYQKLYKDGNHPSIALTYNNIGSAFDEANDGEESKAIVYFKKALDIYNVIYKEKDHDAKALVLNNMGLAYERL